MSDFRLDKYEVTVGRFRRFMDAGKGTQTSPPNAGDGQHPNLTGSGWYADWNQNLKADTASLATALKCDQDTYNNWTDTPGAKENKPINCVDWYEAMAFCIWDGGYLPTEAEWLYAASGGDEQRAYPWSAPASSLTLGLSYATYYDGSACGPTTTPCPGTVDVGSTPMGDGKFGHADLAGNVSEQSLDEQQHSGESMYPQPCVDCARVGARRDSHTVHGGSARENAGFLRSTGPTFTGDLNRERATGFRCARPAAK